jgi:hypothetical protein
LISTNPNQQDPECLEGHLVLLPSKLTETQAAEGVLELFASFVHPSPAWLAPIQSCTSFFLYIS